MTKLDQFIPILSHEKICDVTYFQRFYSLPAEAIAFNCNSNATLSVKFHEKLQIGSLISNHKVFIPARVPLLMLLQTHSQLDLHLAGNAMIKLCDKFLD